MNEWVRKLMKEITWNLVTEMMYSSKKLSLCINFNTLKSWSINGESLLKINFIYIIPSI